MSIVITLADKIYISPQDYFLILFTVLGILATVISIATSLTKEQRQDLILEYGRKDPWVVSYLGWIFFSFLIPYILYLFYPESINLQVGINLLFMFSFVFTFLFIFYLISSLKREKIYKKIFREFKEDLR